jgi:hypothetical protein
MKLSKTALREIIREALLNEEEYDHWRDYKAGLISREEYDQAIKDFQQKNKPVHPYARWSSLKDKYGTARIYLNIPFKDKDTIKKKYFSILWDTDKKSWYMEIPKSPVKFSQELLPLVNTNFTDNKDLELISNLSPLKEQTKSRLGQSLLNNPELLRSTVSSILGRMKGIDPNEIPQMVDNFVSTFDPEGIDYKEDLVSELEAFVEFWDM